MGGGCYLMKKSRRSKRQGRGKRSRWTRVGERGRAMIREETGRKGALWRWRCRGLPRQHQQHQSRAQQVQYHQQQRQQPPPLQQRLPLPREACFRTTPTQTTTTTTMMRQGRQHLHHRKDQLRFLRHQASASTSSKRWPKYPSLQVALLLPLLLRAQSRLAATTSTSATSPTWAICSRAVTRTSSRAVVFAC